MYLQVLSVEVALFGVEISSKFTMHENSADEIRARVGFGYVQDL